MDNLVLIAIWVCNLIGLIEWGVLSLLLMEVIICKDARTVNTTKLLNKSITTRLRILRRSFKVLFYRASVGVFLGSMFGMIITINRLWVAGVASNFFPWTFFSLFFPLSLFGVYLSMGFRLTVFDKFRAVIQGEE